MLKGNLIKPLAIMIRHWPVYLATYGEEHPNVATRWNNLGVAWEAKGQTDKAIEYFEKAYDSFKVCLGVNHPSTVVVKRHLDRVHARQVSLVSD